MYTDFVHPDTTPASASSSNESIVAAIRPSANGITKEEFLTARQSGLSKTYNDKYFELIKTVRDKVYDIYSEKFNMDHFDFIVETKTAEKLSDSSVYVVFYYAYSEEEYDNYEIDDLIELHKGISVDLYNIILEEADYSDLELKMGDLSVAFLLEDEEFNVLYFLITFLLIFG